MTQKTSSLATQMWLPVIALTVVIALVATFSIARTRSQISETTALQERQQDKLDSAQDWRELSTALVAQTQALALAGDGPLHGELATAQGQTLGRIEALPAKLAALLS